MLFCGDNHRRVARTPDEKREILRTFMREHGLKPASWAKRSAVAANSLYNFLNGHSEGLDERTYGKLARTAEVPIWRLTGEQPEPPSPTTVWVSGHVEAGAFREAIEWDGSLWYPVDVPVPTRFRGKAKALETRGTSMNLVYPPGSVVLWVDVLDFRPPRDGDRVVVYAYRSGGEIEATVKELRIDGTNRWLWPRSDDPLHQAPINPTAPGDELTSVEIKGIVIGSYKPEVF
jgi:SOS-response transcriptional repressor LexA